MISLGSSFHDDISAVEILDNGDLVVGGSLRELHFSK